MIAHIFFICALAFTQFCNAGIEPKVQRNLVIAIDSMDLERFADDGGAVASAAGMHMKAKDTCIITTIYALKRVGIDKKKIHNDFKTYQYGYLVILIPKELASSYTPQYGINLKQSSKIYYGDPPNVERVSYAFWLTFTSELCLRLLKTSFLKRDNVLWNVWIIGHGLPYGQTAGFTEGAFQKLLEFFKDKLHTRTFFYNSCYAGGKMLDYLNTGTQQFPFLFVCPCTGENITLFFESSFLSMTKISQLKNTRDLQEIAKLLSASIHALNAPQIRLPNSMHFESPTLKGTKLEHIKRTNEANITSGSIAYASEHAKKAQWIEPTNTDLLLNIPHIKNSLYLQEGNHVLSALKGDSWHYLEQVKAPKLNKEQLFDAFCDFAEFYSHTQKIFVVKEIQCADATMHSVIITLNSVTPSDTPLLYEIFYMIGENGFRVAHPLQGEEVKSQTAPELLWKYQSLFYKIKSRVLQGKQPLRIFYNRYIRNAILWKNELLTLTWLSWTLSMISGMKLAHTTMKEPYATAGENILLASLLAGPALAWWYEEKIANYLRFLDLQDDDTLSGHTRKVLAL